jgi:hypothetical protein
MLQHHRNSPHFSVSFSHTCTKQLRDYKLYRKIKECLPRGVSSFFQKGQLAITAADPVAARNGAAAAAVYPAWRPSRLVQMASTCMSDGVFIQFVVNILILW